MTRSTRTRTTIDLGPQANAARESLRQLAQALGHDGNISALMRWLAEVYAATPDATVTLLEAAGHRADTGDEWITLAIVRQLLPDMALVVRDPMTHDLREDNMIPVSDLTESAQKRADKMEEGPVFARRGGRGWELTQINARKDEQ